MKQTFVLLIIIGLLTNCDGPNKERTKETDRMELVPEPDKHLKEEYEKQKENKELRVSDIDTISLPEGIKFQGNIKTAVRWKDKQGDNIIITTETGETINKSFGDDTYRDAALYSYHYILKGNKADLTWKVYDFIEECPLDIEANFIKNTFQITDLNSNGIAEIWLMYKAICHGDVSPSNMKIVMYEGDQKHAMRGQNKVQVSENEFIGGEYKFDKAFTQSPKSFTDFAIKLWDKNIMQTWE